MPLGVGRWRLMGRGAGRGAGRGVGRGAGEDAHAERVTGELGGQVVGCAGHAQDGTRRAACRKTAMGKCGLGGARVMSKRDTAVGHVVISFKGPGYYCV